MMKKMKLWYLCLFTILLVIPYYHFFTESQHLKSNNIHERSTETLLPYYLRNSPISKDLIVHSAYFDDRARNGHNNVTVIFIVVNKTILDSGWILGCGVSDIETEHFLAFSPKVNANMHEWRGPDAFPYENIIVMCYDLPVKDGSTTFVTYKVSSESSDKIYVESEHPVIVPAPRLRTTGTHNITVVTCTKAFDREVKWFPEFVRYQKTIGVDHVHVSILETFIKDGGFRDHLAANPLLQKAVKDGYVSISVWKDWYKKDEVDDHSEILCKLDCMYRFRGTYDYAFLVDTDDFFTPRIPGKTDLQYYIKEYCYIEPAASCSFSWIFKYPACGIDGEIGPKGNVTKHLKSQQSEKAPIAKSVHSTKALVDATHHDAVCEGCLLPGFEVVQVPEHVAYVAHNRYNQKNTKC